MYETYTVEQVLPTGKTHNTYGQEYQVKFAENEASFKLWFQKVPEVGNKIDGTIDGWKFKKAPRDQQSPQQQASRPQYKADPKGDGMRQGMCVNNAANFVTAVKDPTLTPAQWAKEVWTHAKALYDLGDLDQELPVEDVKTAPKNVQDALLS